MKKLGTLLTVVSLIATGACASSNGYRYEVHAQASKSGTLSGAWTLGETVHAFKTTSGDYDDSGRSTKRTRVAISVVGPGNVTCKITVYPPKGDPIVKIVTHDQKATCQY